MMALSGFWVLDQRQPGLAQKETQDSGRHESGTNVQIHGLCFGEDLYATAQVAASRRDVEVMSLTKRGPASRMHLTYVDVALIYTYYGDMWDGDECDPSRHLSVCQLNCVRNMARCNAQALGSYIRWVCHRLWLRWHVLLAYQGRGGLLTAPSCELVASGTSCEGLSIAYATKI